MLALQYSAHTNAAYKPKYLSVNKKKKKNKENPIKAH